MRLALLTILAVLAFAGTAQAKIGVEFQQDSIRQSPLAAQKSLDLMKSTGATWTRIGVEENRWAEWQDRYVAEAKHFHDAHIKVLVTMYRWQGLVGREPRLRPAMTPQQAAAFAVTVARKLGPYVDAYSVVNEPDLPYFGLAFTTTCKLVPGSATTVKTVNGKVRIVRYKRVKRGRGKYVRKVYTIHSHKRGTWRRVMYKRARTHRQKRLANYVKRVRWVSHPHTISVATTYDQRMCVADGLIAAARKAHDLAAPWIRAIDHGALLVAGEFAWTKDDGLRAFYAAARGIPDVDVIGVHTYHDPSANVAWIKTTVDFARAHGAQTWATEYGHHCGAPGSWFITTTKRLESMGVARAFVYTLVGGGTPGACPTGVWDTGLVNPDFTPRESWTTYSRWLDKR